MLKKISRSLVFAVFISLFSISFAYGQTPRTDSLRAALISELEQQRVGMQNRDLTYAFTGGTIILLLLGVLLHRYNRQKKRANRILKQTLADLRATRNQLMQSEKMASLGELTAGIAHEIKNPLNFVNNFSEVNAELLEEMKQELTGGRISEALNLIDDITDNNEKIGFHGKRADSIVKGMLQHSRSSTGTRELTDINNLADECLRLSYHGMRAKDKTFNATTETYFAPDLPKIEIESQEIGRVFLNLFTNAFYSVAKKQKEGSADYKPVVSVKTDLINGNGSNPDQLCIAIRDNGNGVPVSALDKIFQPFFTTKPTGEGTGLGLSMSHEIITNGHGGLLEVDTKEGQYAEFSVLLPLNR